MVLDVACGTGDLSLELQKTAQSENHRHGFLPPDARHRLEKNKKNDPAIPYVEADGMNLSFADETFDAVTIAFGLRNFSNWQDGFDRAAPRFKNRRKARNFGIFHARRSRFPTGFSILFFAHSAAHRRRGQRFARRV